MVYPEGGQSFPFARIEPQVLPWKDELLEGLPIYDIDAFFSIGEEDPPKVSFIGTGASAVVFRLENAASLTDITVKIMARSYGESEGQLREDFTRSGLVGMTRDLALTMDIYDLSHLTYRQLQGHIIGNRFDPLHIDPPSCVWVSRRREGSKAKLAGYSIPFVEGTPVKICQYPELMACGLRLLQDHRIYVGSPGSSLNWSKNAILTSDGRAKFIDVDYLEEGEWSYDYRMKYYTGELMPI